MLLFPPKEICFWWSDSFSNEQFFLRDIEAFLFFRTLLPASSVSYPLETGFLLVRFRVEYSSADPRLSGGRLSFF